MKTYEAIVKGENIPKPGVPESFKVLIKELQSLALDVKVLDENKHEVELKDDLEDEPSDLNSITKEMSTLGVDYDENDVNEEGEYSLDNLRESESLEDEEYDDIEFNEE